MLVTNSKGKIFYGMHFYAGLAQYQEADKEPYRVFLNEDTIRSMDPSFAGRPVFVEHVDEVDPDVNQLRKEADGWVIESFYNAADGKHWVKFIIVTDRAERAIRSGMRLSNAYVPKAFKDGGLWNGIPYQKEITDGEFEHLAIVKEPRYEESVIKDPDEFKQYNEQKVLELKKLANSKEKGKKMAFNFFKRTKVENAIDPELQVVLPKSGKVVSVAKLINDAYEKDQDPSMDGNPKNKSGESAKDHAMANMDHMVKMHDGSYMKVKDMMNRYKAMNDDLEDLKKKKDDSKEEELDLKVKPEGVDAEGDLHNDPDSEHGLSEHEEEVEREEHKMEKKDDLEHPEDVVHDDEEEDKAAKKKALQLAEHEDKEIEEAKKKSSFKKKNDKEKADRLRNAHLKGFQNDNVAPTLELSYDRVERGKVRYGS
jgi:Uncharacterized protein conserved in bacteria (DUF2213)